MNEAAVVFVRGIIAFLTLLIFTRILGKQQVSELTFFDYIHGITIGSIAATLTTDLSSRAWPHWVGLATWTAAVWFLQWITLHSRGVAKYINGEPVILIKNGQIMEKNLKKMRFTIDDLLTQLRHQQIFDLKVVEFAILETDGKISVLKKSQYAAVTPDDLKIPTKYQGISTELIYDGTVIDANLKQVNLDRNWLDQQLKAQGINSPREVALALLNTEGELYVSQYQQTRRQATGFQEPNTNNE
ncbi:MAG TPA: DUF421 domain-containing protein [Firmicutes bacterium]|uniref:DUF421 domain-containing protein n=1 Tax=Capillibacterium thermochitinicola TaxID=2699427 RepID=A0A8J6I2B2_9FIRM|nr:DUF421 domain-containing protein [Capillibacterium thermochitinicola]MBA2133404.1 DUF421 domain-containing protein [Capillibacterium thermochitinicola]HHW13057.1 DUF421 domain-containing protein [Bacillota bacterium]